MVVSPQRELELLVMEEEAEKARAHFSLDNILQSEGKAAAGGKKRRNKRKETSQVCIYTSLWSHD